MLMGTPNIIASFSFVLFIGFAVFNLFLPFPINFLLNLISISE